MSKPANAPSKRWNLRTLLRLSEDEARTFLEGVRWPDGKAVCPHCAVVGESTRLASKPGSSTRPGVWKCKACRKQFTVTVGTVMERSHISLSTWAAAFFLICSSKKSLSALQLQRQLGIGSYKTAWFLAHRVRYAMASGPLGELLRGAIEADETWVGGRPRKANWDGTGFPPRRGGQGQTTKQPVALVLERGGKARAKMVRDVSVKSLRRFVADNVARNESKLYTDDAAPYVEIGQHFAHGHESVVHSSGQYAKPGGIHSNTAESFFSLFKRGFHGSFHHLSLRHMQRYLDEFAFRWSHKDEKDEDRTVRALRQGDGVRLMYRAPKSFKNLGMA